MNRSASSTGHLDPCAQEFTPGTYAFYQAAAVPPAAPSMFYSYPLEARPYIQPAPSLAATLSSPVLPLYTHPEVAAVPFGSSIPWDNRPLQSQTEMGMQHLGRTPTLQDMTQMGVVPGNRPRKFSTSSSSSSTAIGGSGRGSPFVHGREHATRALLLSPVPVELRESDLRHQLEAWGPIRALDLNKRRDGFVTVLYYDLRHAKNALRDIQQQHLLQQRRLQQHYSRTLSNMENRSSEDVALPPPPPPEPGKGLIGGNAIWAQFAIPVGLPPGPESHNQGTLVVFNLDADINAGTLRSTFEAFGPVKEVRETPTKRQHKFVEFFDVRDAARALEHVKAIAGKPVKIEFSRPGGLTRRATAARSVASAATANVAVVSPPPPLPPLPPPLPGTQFMHNTNHVPLPRPLPRWTKAPLWPLSSFNTSPTNAGSMKPTTSFHHHQHHQPTSSSSSSQQQQQQTQSFSTRNDSSAFRRRRPGGPQQHQNPEPMLLTRPRQLPKFGHHHRRSAVSQFAFDEAKAESNSSDARTTVMIKNIPNKYSQHMLLTMLDHHCINCNERITEPNEPWSAYDFVYLPIDFKNKCNLGYAFVNWTTSKASWKFYKEFHMQPWEAFNSRKICEVTYARIQGREALMEHFSNSKFACDTDEYLPLVFSPPRDGKQPFSYQAMGSSMASASKNLSICNPSSSKSAENEGTSSKSKHEGEERGKDLQEDSTKMSCVIGDSVVTASNNGNRARAYQDKGYFSSRRSSGGNWSQQHCTQSNGSWSERRRAGDLY